MKEHWDRMGKENDVGCQGNKQMRENWNFTNEEIRTGVRKTLLNEGNRSGLRGQRWVTDRTRTVISWKGQHSMVKTGGKGADGVSVHKSTLQSLTVFMLSVHSC